MTILPKPWSYKKKSIEKVPLPLSGPQDEAAILYALKQGALLETPPPPYYNSDADAESVVINRLQHSCIKTFLLFLVSLIVMMMGILGGYTLYRMYVPSHSSLHMRALCDIPYTARSNMTLPRFFESSDDFLPFAPFRLNDEPSTSLLDLDEYFREEIEMDSTDDEGFAKINVPEFKDGRRGRFMHDFKENQSAIVDTSANRCFIMPLDRETTLPPKSFIDLMQKMGSGYYNIDTDRVRRKMRVITPPITDLSQISERIANECYDMKVYMLENYQSGVFKREIRPITDDGRFAEFSGKGIVEYDLLNIAEIGDYERQQKSAK